MNDKLKQEINELLANLPDENDTPVQITLTTIEGATVTFHVSIAEAQHRIEKLSRANYNIGMNNLLLNLDNDRLKEENAKLQAEVERLKKPSLFERVVCRLFGI